MNDNLHIPIDDEVLILPVPEGEEPLIPGRNEALLPVLEDEEPFTSGRNEARLPVPEDEEPPLPVVRPPRTRTRLKRWKLLLIVLGGIVILSVVFGMFSRSAGSGAVQTTGVTHQSTPKPRSASATPTLAAHRKLGGPTTVTSGALILLNPGIVRQGTSTELTGSGFDPRATIDLAIKRRASDTGQVVSFVQADKYGTFSSTFSVPTSLSSGTFFIEASERGSTKVAQATGVVAGGAPQLKLSAQVGKPGDIITVSAHGFSPSETIKVYWNTISGQPVTTLQADGGGGIGQGSVQVPFGAAGVNTFLFVGAKSQALAAASFDLLSLYPSVKLSSYAIRADNQLSFSGAGFGPSERVLVYVNSTSGQPVSVIQTTQKGTFSNAGGFDIPFALKGQQTLIFQGEESGTSVAVNWTVLPYTPNAQASTYGGLPGTTVTFYASGFARNEVVHVYVGHTQNSAGTLVSCFRTDDKGSAASAGSYVIPGNAQGKLVFALTGSKSGGTATATTSVTAAPTAVQVPPQPPFTCPLDTTP
jgi:hypothetical protein